MKNSVITIIVIIAVFSVAGIGALAILGSNSAPTEDTFTYTAEAVDSVRTTDGIIHEDGGDYWHYAIFTVTVHDNVSDSLLIDARNWRIRQDTVSDYGCEPWTYNLDCEHPYKLTTIHKGESCTFSLVFSIVGDNSLDNVILYTLQDIKRA